MLFEFDNVYNFNTISLTVLKPTYKNLKAVSNMGYKQAIRYSGIYNDVVTTRQQLEAETGVSLVEAVDARYVLFEDEYGNEVMLAEDWIEADSIVLVTSIALELQILNISSSDVSIITNTLRALGYDHMEIKIITND